MVRVSRTDLIFIGFIISVTSCRIADFPAVIYEMKTEFQENILGIDCPQPLFQWKMNDDGRGAPQTAHQLFAASSPEFIEEHEGNMWNSGKVYSHESVHHPINMFLPLNNFWQISNML